MITPEEASNWKDHPYLDHLEKCIVHLRSEERDDMYICEKLHLTKNQLDVTEEKVIDTMTEELS